VNAHKASEFGFIGKNVECEDEGRERQEREGGSMKRKNERTSKPRKANETSQEKRNERIYMCVLWTIPMAMGPVPMTHTYREETMWKFQS
jgi:hypothetical protein